MGAARALDGDRNGHLFPLRRLACSAVEMESRQRKWMIGSGVSFAARIHRQTRKRERTGARARAGLDRARNDRDPDAADCGRRAGRHSFENRSRRTARLSDIPVLVNLFGTVKRVAMGVTMGGVERHDAASLREVGELLATLRQPEPPRSFGEAMELLPLAKTVMAMRPKTVGVCHACQEIVLRGVRHRSGAPAHPDLLAGRTRAAHHLAAGRDQGSRRSARGQLQSRHLSHAGDRKEPDASCAGSSIAAARSIMRAGRRRIQRPCPPRQCSAPIRERSSPR